MRRLQTTQRFPLVPITHHSARDVTVIGLALFCTALLGCGKSGALDKVVVSGTVTLDGEPIPNGEVLFYPIEGTPGSVSGGPIKDGKYTAKGRGGVPVGKHSVEIRAFRAPSRAGTGDLAVEGGPAVQYLPPKYNTQSEIDVEIDSSNRTQDFALTSK